MVHKRNSVTTGTVSHATQKHASPYLRTLLYMSWNSQKNSFRLYRKPIFILLIFLVLNAYYQCYCFNVIHVHAIINNSYNKTNKCAEVKIIFLHAIHQNSDMFLSIVVIFREVLNINKLYIKTSMIKTDRNISDFVTYATRKTQRKALISFRADWT